MNDRRRGALMGWAIGDALGAAVEFKRPDSFAPITSNRGGGPHGLSAGERTDDTSMAWALTPVPVRYARLFALPPGRD